MKKEYRTRVPMFPGIPTARCQLRVGARQCDRRHADRMHVEAGACWDPHTMTRPPRGGVCGGLTADPDVEMRLEQIRAAAPAPVNCPQPAACGSAPVRGRGGYGSWWLWEHMG